MKKAVLDSHESFDREPEAQGSSDRNFGLVFSTFMALLAFFPALVGRHPIRWHFAGIAMAFLTVTLARPSMLAPLNRLWTKLGLILHTITSPLILGFVFFVVLTPMALLMRLRGKDPMRRAWDPKAQSYWIPYLINPDYSHSMKDQF